MRKQGSVKSVLDLVGFEDERLWRVIDHYVPMADSPENLSRVRRIGIDEKSIGKGHKYMKAFMDFDVCRVVYMREVAEPK